MPSVGAPTGNARWLLPAWGRGVAYVVLPWAALALPGAASVVTLVALTLGATVLLWRDAQADRAVLLVVAAFTACDVSPLAYDGSVVRLYQLAALQVLVVVLRRRREMWAALRGMRGLPLAALALVLLVTVLTPLSVLWSISTHQTLVSTVGQLSATGLLVVYCAAVAARILPARDVLVAVWAMATLSSAVAVAQFLVTVLTPVDLAMAGGSGVPWPRPEGLMTEAVWAALVAATGAALAFVVRRTWPKLALTSLVLHAATLALVLSRAVVLGMVVGGTAALLVGGRRHATGRRVAAAAVAVVLGVGLVATISPALLQRFDPRLVLGMQGGDGGSAASRGAVYRLVADELPHHMPLGAGAGSLNELTSDPAVREKYIDGGELNSGRGSTNIFLGYTFDFGPAGTAVAVALVVVVLGLGIRLVPVDKGLSVFMTLLFLVDFQFNNGFRFGFVHLLFGVAVAQAALVGRETKEAVSAGSEIRTGRRSLDLRNGPTVRRR